MSRGHATALQPEYQVQNSVSKKKKKKKKEIPNPINKALIPPPKGYPDHRQSRQISELGGWAERTNHLLGSGMESGNISEEQTGSEQWGEHSTGETP